MNDMTERQMRSSACASGVRFELLPGQTWFSDGEVAFGAWRAFSQHVDAQGPFPMLGVFCDRVFLLLVVKKAGFPPSVRSRASSSRE